MLVLTDGGGTLTAAAGFWRAFLGETLATVCLAGLGSALVLVLPIAGLPGRRILRWSPFAWVASVIVVATTLALVTLGGRPSPEALLPWVAAPLAFAALSVATWAFVRFVEPQLRL